eukprot:408493-Pyramimonas_sp.AAC.1
MRPSVPTPLPMRACKSCFSLQGAPPVNASAVGPVILVRAPFLQREWRHGFRNVFGSSTNDRTVGLRRVDQRRPRRRRSTLNAGGGPESVDVERSDVTEMADRSRLNDPRGVRDQRPGRHGTDLRRHWRVGCP